MPVFDAATRRMVLRIVYDGPGFAGKTTNLKRLESFFTEQRRSALVVPEEVEGRTRYFDFMHLDGGIVMGHPLRCQLVTVPGQNYLDRRRRVVLRTADVVVFVCESTEAGVAEARPMLRTLEEVWDERGPKPSFVVQANKQDLPNALAPAEVVAALGLPPSTTVVPADAQKGVGVRETAVAAIRLAASFLQDILLKQGTDSLLGKQVQTHQALLVSMMDDLDTIPPPEPDAQTLSLELVPRAPRLPEVG